MRKLYRQAARALRNAISAGHLTSSGSPLCEIMEPRRLLSASANLDLFGHLGGVTDRIAVSGTTAYVCQGQDLVLINMASPSGPQVTGKVSLPDMGRGIAIAGNYAYIADQSQGLQIVDISNSANPTLIGAYSSGETEGVKISDNYAYLADHSGLEIVNISNPAIPTLAGHVDSYGQAYGVTLTGTKALLASSTGLEIFDITNSASPVALGRYDNDGYTGYDVATAGNYAYLADGQAGLLMLSITNPAAPTLVGFYDTPGDAQTVTLSGSYAFVGDAIGGLQIINISNPSAPTLASNFPTNGYAMGVALTGNHALVATEYGGIQVLDVSNPSAPSLVTGYPGFGAFGEAVAVVGATAYVADSAYGLLVIDISAPSNPVLLGVCTMDNSYAYGVAVSGDYAYIADFGTGMRVINIADPAHPTLVTTYTAGIGLAFGIAVSGNYAYLADREVLDIINISDPTHPTRVGRYTEDFEYAYSVTVVGNYAYIANGPNGLQIIDVSKPDSPTTVGTYQPDWGWAYDVSVSGGLAYLAYGPGGLSIVDVSNPASPTPIGAYNAAIAMSVATAGNFAYVADQNGSVIALDISDPSQPSLSYTYLAPGTPNDITISGQYAYLTSRFDGLSIIHLSQVYAPDNLSLSGNQVREGLSIGSPVGTLSATDQDAGDVLTYSLVSGQGSNGNGSFSIDGNVLRTKAVLKRSTQSSYNVRIRVTDSHGLYIEQPFVISVLADTTPPSMTSVTVNDGSVQRSMVNKLTITFTEPVNLTNTAFGLTKRNGAAVPGLTLTRNNPSGDQKTWELTFSGTAVSGGSLPDGKYTLTVWASGVTDVAGNRPTGNPKQGFYRLFGDFDGNRVVNRADITRFRPSLNNSGSYVSWLDANGDGRIDSADYVLLRLRTVRSLLR